jgi:hypothetical protein
MNIIVKLLQKLAGLLDKYIPGQGARHIVLVILAIVAHVAMYLQGAESAEAAAAGIVQAIAVIFAAKHIATPK